jgi:hypothetical protein
MGDADKQDPMVQVKALQKTFREAADSIAEGAETLDELYSDWRDTIKQLEQANDELFEDSRSLSWVALLIYFLLGALVGGAGILSWLYWYASTGL